MAYIVKYLDEDYQLHEMEGTDSSAKLNTEDTLKRFSSLNDNHELYEPPISTSSSSRSSRRDDYHPVTPPTDSAFSLDFANPNLAPFTNLLEMIAAMKPSPTQSTSAFTPLGAEERHKRDSSAGTQDLDRSQMATLCDQTTGSVLSQGIYNHALQQCTGILPKSTTPSKRGRPFTGVKRYADGSAAEDGEPSQNLRGRGRLPSSTPIYTAEEGVAEDRKFTCRHCERAL